MTLKDLKSGMICELRSGKLYLVVGDFITNDDGFFVLEDFENNLKSKSSFKYVDIVKVYEIDNYIYKNNAGSLKTLFDKKHLKLLWERKEITLTDREKEVLKVLDTLGFNLLARDKNGTLYVYGSKTLKKSLEIWFNDDIDRYYFPIKKNVLTLDFIKWEDNEPTSIKGLLK